ncbi:uncharacterized protein LOC126829818 isoform X2 [Patella vulgata]|uniref:uncharacterized protein LOC126829818 isoform X2 n=1 Tax=Patella vulgata TaxID=6465 RepID=UPI00217FF90A|nr:uncharacterized protein LOC126829818 isoform X2 [Patella vulgata]
MKCGLFLTILFGINSYGMTAAECNDTVASTCEVEGGNYTNSEACRLIRNYKACFVNADCFSGSYKSHFEEYVRDHPHVDCDTNSPECNTTAVLTCGIEAGRYTNSEFCRLLRNYKACLVNADCFSGSYKSGFEEYVRNHTHFDCECNTTAASTCDFQGGRASNSEFCRLLGNHKACLVNADCFRGSYKSHFEEYVRNHTHFDCDTNSAECNTTAALTCGIEAGRYTNSEFCRLLRNYKACLVNADCFSGSYKSGFEEYVRNHTHFDCDIISSNTAAPRCKTILASFCDIKAGTYTNSEACKLIRNYKACLINADCFSGSFKSHFDEYVRNHPHVDCGTTTGTAGVTAVTAGVSVMLSVVMTVKNYL